MAFSARMSTHAPGEASPSTGPVGHSGVSDLLFHAFDRLKSLTSARDHRSHRPTTPEVEPDTESIFGAKPLVWHHLHPLMVWVVVGLGAREVAVPTPGCQLCVSRFEEIGLTLPCALHCAVAVSHCHCRLYCKRRTMCSNTPATACVQSVSATHPPVSDEIGADLFGVLGTAFAAVAVASALNLRRQPWGARWRLLLPPFRCNVSGQVSKLAAKPRTKKHDVTGAADPVDAVGSRVQDIAAQLAVLAASKDHARAVIDAAAHRQGSAASTRGPVVVCVAPAAATTSACGGHGRRASSVHPPATGAAATPVDERFVPPPRSSSLVVSQCGGGGGGVGAGAADRPDGGRRSSLSGGTSCVPANLGLLGTELFRTALASH